MTQFDTHNLIKTTNSCLSEWTPMGYSVNKYENTVNKPADKKLSQYRVCKMISLNFSFQQLTSYTNSALIV